MAWRSAGVPSKPNFGSKRSRCDQTAEFGIIAKELVKKRKAEAGEVGVGVFEAGWSILTRAEPLGTKDLQFLVVKAEEKLGVAVMGRSHFKALVEPCSCADGRKAAGRWAEGPRARVCRVWQNTSSSAIDYLHYSSIGRKETARGAHLGLSILQGR
jgi:hypothetical protein